MFLQIYIIPCPLLPHPTDLWDWHIYTHPNDMFAKRNEFNGRTPQNSNFIFASEYAVTEGGGWGNLIGGTFLHSCFGFVFACLDDAYARLQLHLMHIQICSYTNLGRGCELGAL